MRFRHAAKADTECPSLHYEVGDKLGVSFAAMPVVHPSGEICTQFTHLV